MEILTLSILILALIISCLAYYRSGRKDDIGEVEQTLDQKIERVSLVAKRAADSVAASLRVGYERRLRMIADLQARVAALRDEAIEEIRDDLKALAQKLDRMAERAARELESIKAGVDFTLMETEIGLRLTLDDAKAHLKVIEAKRELVFARLAILRNQLVEAEVRVEVALRNLQEAQALAVGYHENIAAVQQQAQEMLVAIRTRAETMRTSIDALLERSSRLLKEMSGLEAAAKTAA
jgi:hypothetical protein